jgi:hypothetical protein
MRTILAVHLALVLPAFHSPAVLAQQRFDPMFQNHVALRLDYAPRPGFVPLRPLSLSAGTRQSQASTTRLVASGLIGGAAGLAIGGLAGAVIGGTNSEGEEEWIDAVWGSAIGGTVAESIGLAAGVHLSNRREGSLLLGMLASLAIGGVGLAVLAENQDPPIAPVVLIATPLAQLAATIGIERATR